MVSNRRSELYLVEINDFLGKIHRHYALGPASGQAIFSLLVPLLLALIDQSELGQIFLPARNYLLQEEILKCLCIGPLFQSILQGGQIFFSFVYLGLLLNQRELSLQRGGIIGHGKNHAPDIYLESGILQITGHYLGVFLVVLSNFEHNSRYHLLLMRFVEAGAWGAAKAISMARPVQYERINRLSQNR